MDERRSLDATNTRSSRIWVDCERCNKRTAHKALTEVTLRNSSPDGDIHVGEHYLTVECQGCLDVSFLKESWCSEDLYWDEEAQQMIPKITQEVFPSRLSGRASMEYDYLLPGTTRSVYDQTRRALCNDMGVLAGIGIRCILETVCNEKKTGGLSLEKKIDSLVLLGHVTQEGADILHDLRLLGNDAAHAAKSLSREDLILAFEIVEHLLTSVYVLPQKAKSLRPKVRKKSKN